MFEKTVVEQIMLGLFVVYYFIWCIRV